MKSSTAPLVITIILLSLTLLSSQLTGIRLQKLSNERHRMIMGLLETNLNQSLKIIELNAEIGRLKK